MAKATFVNGIESIWGAIDSAKEGKRNGYRLVVRRHEYGEGKNYDEDGNKWHELYYYHLHEGAWSEGARQNREVIKAAQRTAHDIEHICGHPEAYDERWRAEAETWVARYAAYRAHIPAGSTRYYHFYNYVYVTIYREMQGKDKM